MLWQSGEILLIIDFLNLSIPYPDQTVSQSQRIGKIHRQDHHCNIFFQKPFHQLPDMTAHGHFRIFKRLYAQHDLRMLHQNSRIYQIILLLPGQVPHRSVKYVLPQQIFLFLLDTSPDSRLIPHTPDSMIHGKT